MRMPPRGQRYIVANWISMATASACVLAGTVLLWSVQEQLPARLPVRWDEAGPVQFANLDVVLVAGAGCTLGLVLLGLGAGRAVYGSFGK